jgi:hypothetical protein
MFYTLFNILKIFLLNVTWFFNWTFFKKNIYIYIYMFLTCSRYTWQFYIFIEWNWRSFCQKKKRKKEKYDIDLCQILVVYKKAFGWIGQSMETLTHHVNFNLLITQWLIKGLNAYTCTLHKIAHCFISLQKCFFFFFVMSTQEEEGDSN